MHLSGIRKKFVKGTVLILFVLFLVNSLRLIYRQKPSKRLNSDEFLQCLTDGKWVQRLVSEEEKIARKVSDEKIQTRIGWPRDLHHSSEMCGRTMMHPENSRLPLLCDPKSDIPCCNEDIGLCGNGQEYCSCANCTDFSKFLSAELSDWIPSGECPLKIFDSKSACSLLNNHLKELVFVGDSLIRHVFSAFAILVTDDPFFGAISKDIPLNESVACEGEFQFVDPGFAKCFGKIVHDWEQFRKGKFCQGNGDFKGYLVEAYSNLYTPLLMGKVKGFAKRKGTVLIIGVGMHQKGDSKNVIEHYLGPAVEYVEKYGEGWPKIIWVTIHSTMNFLVRDLAQIQAPFYNYNQEMIKYCREHHIPVFDTFELTRGIRSYDGRHFTLGGNMMKVQILLNYIERMVKEL